MAKWQNPEEWQKLISGEACPITQNGKPLGVIKELPASWLTSNENAPLRGYCCLVAKTFAIELHEMSRDECSAFFYDVQVATRAIQTVTQCIKINYEIHGNTIPRLHMHIYPRYVGDCFEGQAIDWKKPRPKAYTKGEFDQLMKAIVQAIDSDPDGLPAQ